MLVSAGLLGQDCAQSGYIDREAQENVSDTGATMVTLRITGSALHAVAYKVIECFKLTRRRKRGTQKGSLCLVHARTKFRRSVAFPGFQKPFAVR